MANCGCHGVSIPRDDVLEGAILREAEADDDNNRENTCPGSVCQRNARSAVFILPHPMPIKRTEEEEELLVDFDFGMSEGKLAILGEDGVNGMDGRE